ncbi:hypothetical protein V8C86DRAFT_2820175 [Haematococcus lacustris]
MPGGQEPSAWRSKPIRRAPPHSREMRAGGGGGRGKEGRDLQRMTEEGQEEAEPDLDALLDAYTAEAEAQLAQHERKHGSKAGSQPKGMAGRRQAGLSQALAPDNKGFQLLKAMGYQAGQGLGRGAQGPVEPLPLLPKMSRTGLGVDEQKRRAAAAAHQAALQEQAKRARLEAVTAVSFTQANRDGFAARKALQQLEEAWRAAQSLAASGPAQARALLLPTPGGERGQQQQQQQQGLEGPPAATSAQEHVSLLQPLHQELDRNLQQGQVAGQHSPAQASASGHAGPQDGTATEQEAVRGCDLDQLLRSLPALWPVLLESNELPEDLAMLLEGQGQEPDGRPSVTSRRPTQDQVAALPGVPTIPIHQQLQLLLHYLRSRHQYCLYCGCSYDDAAQMEAQCPGPLEDDH